VLAKSTDGIEAGEYEADVKGNADIREGEAKPRSGEGSAKSNIYAHPRTEFAHKRPCCD
jgi:hypothetical protein